MKKVLFMAAFAVFGLTQSNAQEVVPAYGFEDGAIMLEGGLGFNTTKDKNSDTKTSSFSISPKLGYFVTEDFAVGVQADYSSAQKEVVGTKTNDVRAFGAGVFARYYFLELGNRFKTYTELGVGYDSGKDKINDYKTDGFGAGLTLGINYFVTDNIAISFGLADVVSYRSAKVDGAKAVSGFNGSLNVFDNFFDTAQFGLLFKL